ncbi:hypothetical protein SPBR_08673 [Sporothrix brasiliensis 5110]|uniref:Uncharacterized protein n=1 Tax=Sporothrix brasiliensis 5110 TaxID=1398154 RepID=A0A0C2IMY3_9PEZI|nr:uncharacterized protein SPBR_08673 [Sporothrix brasiliensis 5110]KIH86342.1 hypothetical protein SPBR_08673 [Sporothrix brasiliensis 5110]
MHIQDAFRRYSFSSRASSSSLSDRDDDDAITPVEDEYCEAKLQGAEADKQAQASAQTQEQCRDPPTPNNTPAELDNAVLWHRMLALQRRYHCYNSARMSAALEDEAVEAAVPPRPCLDLLNDSIASSWVCDEAPDEVAALLVLVPDRRRSWVGGCYGELAAASSATAAASTKPDSTETGRTSVDSVSTTTPSNNGAARHHEQMRRQRVWRKRREGV